MASLSSISSCSSSSYSITSQNMQISLKLEEIFKSKILLSKTFPFNNADISLKVQEFSPRFIRVNKYQLDIAINKVFSSMQVEFFGEDITLGRQGLKEIIKNILKKEKLKIDAKERFLALLKLENNFFDYFVKLDPLEKMLIMRLMSNLDITLRRDVFCFARGNKFLEKYKKTIFYLKNRWETFHENKGILFFIKQYFDHFNRDNHLEPYRDELHGLSLILDNEEAMQKIAEKLKVVIQKIHLSSFNLEILNFENKGIRNGFFLSELIILKQLNFKNNQLRDISFLVKLVNLELLNLEGNQIRDITFVSGLIKLRELIVTRNPIEFLPKSLNNLQNLQNFQFSFSAKMHIEKDLFNSQIQAIKRVLPFWFTYYILAKIG